MEYLLRRNARIDGSIINLTIRWCSAGHRLRFFGRVTTRTASDERYVPDRESIATPFVGEDLPKANSEAYLAIEKGNAILHGLVFGATIDQ